jgi:Peptidase family M23
MPMRELTYFPLLERYPMTSPYGYRVDPITGAQGKFHRGVDYGAPHGAPVIAPYDGTVTTGYEAGGAGNWLWVVDGPYTFKSFHHASHCVYSGWVQAGTVVAYIDSTGSSTGSHAHLELWDHGTNIDPTGYFNRAPLKDEDEMTEDDWARLQQIVDASINEAMKFSYTGLRALKTDGDPGVYYLVDTDEGLRRRHIPTPDRIRMMQWTDFIAGTGDGKVRTITDPALRSEFLSIPVVNDND